MSICLCGHAKYEHGDDPDSPDSSQCNVDYCECDFFEEDEDAEVDEEDN
jgi:hypothetical protein